MPLVDRFGRTIRKLRISVTDRCNFRCVYCMPAGPIAWLPRHQLLTYEEITRLTGIMVGMGVEKVRLTGGEPLARRDIPRLVRLLSGIEGLHSISMTTNGYFLPPLAQELRQAGLTSVNISLDTLRRDRFLKITGRDYFDRVMEGIEAADAAGLPVKINAVVMRDFNDDEIGDFSRWAAETGHAVRFIEFMPLDGDQRWDRSRVVTAEEILARLADVGSVEPVHNDPSEPARLYRVGLPGARPAVIGIIPTVSQPFCRHCDRIRLTAEGRIRNCLFAVEEHDLRTLLRSGADDATLAEAIAQAVWIKWEGHLINRPEFRRPAKAMYAIGG
ncbi:GTP 3',8-cyclase MoaA [Carboxydochorda subterranea]|uniref:GTP 3',8-cyclase n=1 Tax=Carboxydichorda subterranea TaxID=3109565 RepID=A0ABZ1BXZ1_9FIRM|nr:GTP 3',8-cyclase MoaA [Limnochorda sp. L945t]WRP17375.1 GTP 3',8-cyclase MoaA [Limnochorda sp. L945t]